MNIGLDIGYHSTKVVNGQPVIFPSQSGRAIRLHDFGLNDNVPTPYYLTDPWPLFVGHLAVEQSVGSPNTTTDWFRTRRYKALFLCGLMSMTEATHANVTLVSGLPIRYMAYKDELEAQFSGAHSAQLRGRRAQTLTVARCKFVPQGVGVLLDIVLSDIGKLMVSGDEFKSQRTGIIDIGGQTTNVVSVLGLKERANETGSTDIGAWQVERQVRTVLADEYPDLMDRVGEHELINTIISGNLRRAGKPLPIRDIAQPVIDAVATDVLEFIGGLWNTGVHLDKIYMAGGGARMFLSHVQAEYPHATLVDGPVWANARGYYKLSVRLEA